MKPVPLFRKSDSHAAAEEPCRDSPGPRRWIIPRRHALFAVLISILRSSATAAEENQFFPRLFAAAQTTQHTRGVFFARAKSANFCAVNRPPLPSNFIICVCARARAAAVECEKQLQLSSEWRNDEKNTTERAREDELNAWKIIV